MSFIGIWGFYTPKYQLEGSNLAVTVIDFTVGPRDMRGFLQIISNLKTFFQFRGTFFSSGAPCVPHGAPWVQPKAQGDAAPTGDAALVQWFNEWFNEWFNDWSNEWFNDWFNGTMSGSIIQ